MSLADDKRGIFTTIGSYVSLIQEGELALQSDTMTSINNKDEIVPFLLDVLKTAAGTEAIKEVIGNLFGKIIDETEPKLKTALKKQFIHSNSNQVLPPDFISNGITVPVKTIDINGKFKVNPNTTTGNLIYGSTKNFNTVGYDSILNSGSFQTYGNMLIKYDDVTDNFQIKPTLDSASLNVGEYFTNYIDDTELLNKKEIMSSVMDVFYGTLTANQNKTVTEAYNGLVVDTLLEQVLNDDDSFVVSQQKYDELLSKAREMVQGVVTYDLGCGLMSSELNLADFSNTITSISGSTDPFYIGDQLGNTIDQSTEDVTEETKENKETIKDSFFQKLISIFTVKMLEAVTTAPQVRALFGIMSSFENNGVINLSDPAEDIKNFKTTIKCMAKEIMEAIAAYIFGLAVSYLVMMLKPIIKKVVKEKINQFVGVIKSLTGANKFI